MRRFILPLLLLIGIHPLHAQLELEAEGNIGWIVDNPDVSDFGLNATSRPIPGLALRAGYTFDVAQNYMLGLGLKYTAYGSMTKDDGKSVEGSGETTTFENRLTFYDNMLGPVAAFYLTTGSNRLQSIGIETGFQFFISKRRYYKVDPPVLSYDRGSDNFWVFDRNGIRNYFFLPLSVSARFQLREKGNWLIAPKLTYAFTDFFDSYENPYLRNHHLQLGCSFIWRK